MTAEDRAALVLFAKDPEEGRVKTRLNPFLDSKTTLELYKNFLIDSITKICSVEDVDRFVGIASETKSGFFEKHAQSRGIHLFVQEGHDLGERMRRAFDDRFREGYRRVVIIGADSPSLPVAFIDQALGMSREVVIGPSTDGGYYLIGMKEKTAPLFDGISWGTGQVLSETLGVLKGKRIRADLLPVWYDVDLPEDLRFLKTHLQWMEQTGLPVEGISTMEFLGPLRLE